MGLDNPLHIAFLVVILLLLFGAKRLPEIGRQLGSGMREFKDSVTGSEPNRQQQAALPQATQVAAPVAPAPAPPAQAAPQPAAPVATPAAPVPGQAPVAEPAPVEPSHQA
jgi:sec-independent protein translocase protein TatA